jgi:hypothetical protein
MAEAIEEPIESTAPAGPVVEVDPDEADSSYGDGDL